MHRARAFLLAIASAHVASASPTKPVDTLVRTFLGHAGTPARLAPTLRPDAMVVLDSSIARNATGDDAATYLQSIEIRSVGPLSIATDDAHHAAWFQGTAKAVAVDPTGDHCPRTGCPPPPSLDVHVTGLAIDDHGWKLAAIVVTTTVGDRDAIARAKQPRLDAVIMPAAPTISGDATIAAAVASWLSSAQLARTAAHATVYADGSAPGELAHGAAAPKLAATWDQLGLAAASIEAHPFGDGALGVVYADTRWPNQPGVVIDLRLAAIVVRDGDSWRWLALDFSAN